jgi:hypothetical protein
MSYTVTAMPPASRTIVPTLSARLPTHDVNPDTPTPARTAIGGIKNRKCRTPSYVAGALAAV